MLRDGVVPRPIHGLFEYLIGVLFVAAPFLLDYGDGSATAVSIVIGVVVLALAAATDGPTSVSNVVKIEVHVILDYLLAALLIASPFLFSFTDDGAATAVFIAVGVLHLLVTIGTRFKSPR